MKPQYERFEKNTNMNLSKLNEKREPYHVASQKKTK